MKKSPKTPSPEEIEKINRVQSDFFGGLVHVFDPPLPEGVPERLNRIVALARIEKGDTILDVGSGTGILIPIIQSYHPKEIVACDLCEEMLDHLVEQYPFVRTIQGDIRDVEEPDEAFDVIFVNACYPNIVDKQKSVANIARMMKAKGRFVISHPMGKLFIEKLKSQSPFPLDDFPDLPEAELFLKPFGLHIALFEDEPEMYLLLAEKTLG